MVCCPSSKEYQFKVETPDTLYQSDLDAERVYSDLKLQTLFPPV